MAAPSVVELDQPGHVRPQDGLLKRSHVEDHHLVRRAVEALARDDIGHGLGPVQVGRSDDMTGVRQRQRA